MKHLIYFSLAFLSVFGEYSDDFTRNTFWPLAAAVSTGFDPNVCIKSGTGDGELRRKIEVVCEPIYNETCAGYTAFSKAKNAIIIGFRGTEGTNEQNLEGLDILLGPQLTFPGGAKVADFFYNGFTLIWNGGMKDDFFTLQQKNPGAEIWITGHSLGAAMAGLAAGYLAQMEFVDGKNIKLIAFGEPRIGDKKFAALIDSKIPYAYRVIHNNDWVPHVPLVLENYEHHGTEIWYPNNMAIGDPYTVCKGNEDKSCSASVPANQLSGDAHGFYFNIEMWKFQRNGCVYK